MSKGGQPPMRMNTKPSALCWLEMEYKMLLALAAINLVLNLLHQPQG